MNWHMIISGLIVVVLKAAGVTLFLLYFSQIFGKSNNNNDDSFTPTRSYGTVCPKDWDFYQGRCFFLSTSESSWSNGKNDCVAKDSNLAVVNTPEKLKYLQDLAGAEKYFIGLIYQPMKKKWRWINNSVFNGNVTGHFQNFNCVTIGLTTTFDAAFCNSTYHWICEKNPQ